MTLAYAWIDGDMATDDEKADAADLAAWKPAWMGGKAGSPKRRTMHGTLYLEGPRKNQIYILVVVNDNDLLLDGDFSERYRKALEALLESDKRIRDGDAFTIGII